MTSAPELSRCDDIDEMQISFFKINLMLAKKRVRIAQANARVRFIKLVVAVSSWIHPLLVLYQAGRSSFLSNIHYGVVYFNLAVGCIWLLPPAVCGNSFTSGEPTNQLDSHLRPGVAPAGTAEERQRNVRPVCGGGERHLPQQKRYVSLPPYWDACLNWLSVDTRSDFYCGSWLTGHQYETSFPVPAEPEWETHLTKEMAWITRNVSTPKPPCLV